MDEKQKAYVEQGVAAFVNAWELSYGPITDALMPQLGLTRTEVLLFLLLNQRNVMMEENRAADERHQKQADDYMERALKVLEYEERRMDEDEDWKP